MIAYSLVCRHTEDDDFPETVEAIYLNEGTAQKERTSMNAQAIGLCSPFRYFVEEMEVIED